MPMYQMPSTAMEWIAPKEVMRDFFSGEMPIPGCAYALKVIKSQKIDTPLTLGDKPIADSKYEVDMNFVLVPIDKNCKGE